MENSQDIFNAAALLKLETLKRYQKITWQNAPTVRTKGHVIGTQMGFPGALRKSSVPISHRLSNPVNFLV